MGASLFSSEALILDLSFSMLMTVRESLAL